jgi:alpha-aminoadipic semialdehyde synthase
LEQADFSVGFDALSLPAELKRALIVYRGELTPDYAYLKSFMEPKAI